MLTRSLRPYYLMGGLIVVFLFVTAGAGLLDPEIYRPYIPNASLYAGLIVQDAASLLAAALLVAAMVLTARGSMRAFVAWTGLLVYVAYYYAFFCFGFTYTPYYPLYLALMGLAAYSLIGLLTSVHAGAFAQRVDARLPVWLPAAVLGLTVLFIPLWLMAIEQGIAAGQAPDTALVFVLDLCFLIPAMLYGCVQIARRRPLGYLIGGPLLIKGAASGLLLTGGSLRQMQLGFAVGPDFAMYVFLAVAGSVALVVFLRHLHDEPAVGQAPAARRQYQESR